MKTLVAFGFCTSAALALGLALRAPLAPAVAAPASYDIDTQHSSLLFRAKHLNISYVYGRFNEFSGQFTIDSAKPENSKVAVEIKVDSVDSGIDKRDAHLKSPDFFDAKQFPTATFKSKSVKKSKNGHYEVAGDFMLRGVTKPITLDVEEVGSAKDPFGSGQRAGYFATLTVKRSDFGVSYMPDALGDEVLITISVEGVSEEGGKSDK